MVTQNVNVTGEDQHLQTQGNAEMAQRALQNRLFLVRREVGRFLSSSVLCDFSEMDSLSPLRVIIRCSGHREREECPGAGAGTQMPSEAALFTPPGIL